MLHQVLQDATSLPNCHKPEFRWLLSQRATPCYTNICRMLRLYLTATSQNVWPNFPNRNPFSKSLLAGKRLRNSFGQTFAWTTFLENLWPNLWTGNLWENLLAKPFAKRFWESFGQTFGRKTFKFCPNLLQNVLGKPLAKPLAVNRLAKPLAGKRLSKPFGQTFCKTFLGNLWPNLWPGNVWENLLARPFAKRSWATFGWKTFWSCQNENWQNRKLTKSFPLSFDAPKRLSTHIFGSKSMASGFLN